MSAFTSDDVFKDDFDEDFIPSGGSNLAAIFGIRPKGQDSTPKQTTPKKIALPNNSQVANKTEVIIAKAVHAFKLQNGEYISIGKLGMALTGNVLTKTYQIILYKSKQERISVSTLTHDFSYTVQPNNYSTYYDTNNENWSILFESNEACAEFAREIGLVKYFLKQGKLDNVIYQDLIITSKDMVAKEGCNISIKYFVAEITQPFKAVPSILQNMTVEITTDDSWERILLGMCKGFKRVFFLPPNKQIGLGPSFPKEKDIMLEVEILDISSPDKVPGSLKNDTSCKASILSRVAKMGQSMLPKLPTSTTTDSEDTEDDVPHKVSRHKKVESVETSVQKKHLPQESIEDVTRSLPKVIKSRKEVSSVESINQQTLTTTSAFASQWSPTQIQPNYVKLDGQTYMLQPQTISQPISTIMDPNINMLLSETRMANTEIRMGMSKIADNVQKILDKFHNLELQTATTPTNDKTMETMVKMLHAMNASQFGTKSISEGNHKQDENLLILVKEKDDKIAALEAELKKTKELLTDTVKLVDDSKDQKTVLMQTNNECIKKIEELEALVNNTKSILETKTKELEKMQNLVDQYAKEKDGMESRILELVKECDALKLNVQIDNPTKNKELKYIMNKVYHTLLEKFTEDSYPTGFIKSTVASTIKNITLQVLYEHCEDTDPVRNTHTIDVNLIESAILDEPPPIPPNDTEDEGE